MAQNGEIFALQDALAACGRVVMLQKSEITLLDSLVLGKGREVEAVNGAEKELLKTKIKRLWAWLVGLVGIDVAILLVLLLL